MKRSVLMFSLVAGLTSISPAAHASLDDFLKNVNIQAQADKNGYKVKLSTQFGIPETDVNVIVSNVSSPADAFMVLQLSHMTHQEPEKVLQHYQRSKGKGWGRLGQELGIKPGSPEFHALRNGNLTFTGNSGEGTAQRNNEHGNGHGNGRGKGRGRDKD